MPPPEPVTVEVSRDGAAARALGVSIQIESLFVFTGANGAFESARVALALSRGERRGRLELSRGAEEPVTRTWCGLRLTVLSATTDEQRVTLRIEGRYQLGQVVRLLKDKRVAITPELVVTFRRHGHKRTVDGGRSPLMVSYVRHDEDGDRDQYVSVYTHEARDFAMGDITLELVDHHYDDWMDVRVISTP